MKFMMMVLLTASMAAGVLAGSASMPGQSQPTAKPAVAKSHPEGGEKYTREIVRDELSKLRKQAQAPQRRGAGRRHTVRQVVIEVAPRQGHKSVYGVVKPWNPASCSREDARDRRERKARMVADAAQQTARIAADEAIREEMEQKMLLLVLLIAAVVFFVGCCANKD